MRYEVVVKYRDEGRALEFDKLISRAVGVEYGDSGYDQITEARELFFELLGLAEALAAQQNVWRSFPDVIQETSIRK